MKNISRIVAYLTSLFCFSIAHINVYATPVAADFFALPDMVTAKVSPDGNNIAAIRYHNEQQQISLIDTTTQKEQLLLALTDKYKEGTSISRIVWLDSQHVAAQLVEVKKGIEELVDTQSSRRLIIVRIPNEQKKIKIYSVRTKGWLVNPLPSEPGVFLYAKSSLYSKVYKISIAKLAFEGKKLNKLSKIDGGQFKSSNEVTSITGFATRWFFDREDQAKAVLHFDDEGVLLLSAFDNGETSVLKSWKNDDKDAAVDSDTEKKLLPLEYSSHHDSFYSIDFNEEEKRTVYLVNYKTQEEKIVYEADSYKIIDIELSESQDMLTSVKVINNGAVETIFIGDKKESDHEPDILATEINKDLSSQTRLIYRESHNNAGQFFMQKGNVTTVVGEKYPVLSGQMQSRLIESSIKVEGLEIPYLLSLPQTKKVAHPLIVMPHGGPIGVYDNRYYDPIVQYLVTQGYAVLRVNFRGSSGYNKALKVAGRNQWADLMLEDIYQATLNAIARDDINGDKVCSFGMSYGGYAALMLTLKHPQLYKCAANWAGVMDLSLYVNNPRTTQAQKKWIKKNVGISDWPYSRLKANSPVYLVDKLVNPVLVAHGGKDKIVDAEHAFRMKLMLDKYKKNYHWYQDDEGTHSFGSAKQMDAFFAELTTFLTQYIH